MVGVWIGNDSRWRDRSSGHLRARARLWRVRLREKLTSTDFGNGLLYDLLCISVRCARLIHFANFTCIYVL